MRRDRYDDMEEPERMGKISDIISSELTKSTMQDNVDQTRIRAGW